MLFLATDDRRDPSLSSENMGHVLDPSSPRPHTTYVHLEPQTGQSVPHLHPTAPRTGDQEVQDARDWYTATYTATEALPLWSSTRTRGPLRIPEMDRDTDRQGGATWGQFIAVKYLSLSLFFSSTFP